MIVSMIAVSRYQMYGSCRSAPFHLSQIIRKKSNVPFYSKPLHSFKNIFPFGNFINQTIFHKFPNFKRFSMILIIANEFKKAPKVLKDNSEGVLKSCVAQFEFVLAYRIRRGQQIINLYTKLWDEMALKRFFQQIRRLVYRRGKEFLLGGAAVTYDWKNGRIPEEDLKSHADELEICSYLRDKLNEDQVCLCDDKPCPHDFTSHDATCWTPFIQQTDLIVWKKEEENHKGLFCYKMYGRYPDVTAKDFLTVFLDTENRAKWDQHVVILKVIDSEPSTNSDVIYWETKWPKLFSNRDYVFTRRYLVDEKEKVMIVMNRTTEHPSYPVMASKSRVTEYWSHMVIRPISGEFNKPGIEFCLTYFDNPGMSVPSAISSWASSTAMPQYIKRLRIEALKIYDLRTFQESIPSVDDSIVAPEKDTKKMEKNATPSRGEEKLKVDEPSLKDDESPVRGGEDKHKDDSSSPCGDSGGDDEDKHPVRCGKDKHKEGRSSPPCGGGGGSGGAGGGGGGEYDEPPLGCDEDKDIEDGSLKPCCEIGGGEDGPSTLSNPVSSKEKKEDKFEPFLLWTSLMEKIGVKGGRKNINMDS